MTRWANRSVRKTTALSRTDILVNVIPCRSKEERKGWVKMKSPRCKDGSRKFFYQLCCLHGGMVAVLMASADSEFILAGAGKYGFGKMWIQKSTEPAVKNNQINRWTLKSK